jgi:gastric triacylglycerol lipase
MKVFAIVALSALLIGGISTSFTNNLRKDPCGDNLFSDMVTSLGYPFESHHTTTDDGYILRLFRIQAKGTKITPGKKVVFLQHGLIDSADDWVVNEETKSLGLVLAQQGYDVWMGNSRGNKYSRANTHITPIHRDFWYYSFQEMGEFDVKANLGYVTAITGKDKITYVGHSQGTSQMFAALSDKATTDYVHSKLNGFIALAPVAYLANSNSKLIRLLANDGILIESAKLFGMEEWLPGACSKTSAQSEFEYYLCKLDVTLCDIFISLLADYNPKYDNQKMFPTFVQHNPSGSSLRSLLHYRQLLESDKHHPVFRKFDYGRVENEKKYGQKTPPDYDLNLINLPVRGFIGTDDELGDPVDNAFLTAKLQNLGKDYKTYTYDNCGHLTFMWAQDPSAIFADVIREIAAFNA